MPMRTNAPMNANASVGIKVLPIAKIPIKKTGRLRINAEATGKITAGRQPPNRFLNQNSDGAYANEKSSAATISEATVTLLTSTALRFNPSTKTKVTSSAESPTSHDANEMQSSFMMLVNQKFSVQPPACCDESCSSGPHRDDTNCWRLPRETTHASGF